MEIDWTQVRQFAVDSVLPTAIRIGVVFLLYVSGRAIARAVVRLIDRTLERQKADVSLRRFVCDVAYFAMLAAVVVIALDTFGVKTTALVAVLGAAGLAIGLALQGSLSNLAAGVMLILLRPLRIGDHVTFGKYTGRVEAIKVFHTTLITPDHRQITLPNSQVLAQPIENLTTLGRRRIDIVVSVGDVPVDTLERELVSVAMSDERIDAEPKPIAELVEINDAGAKLMLRAWTAAELQPTVTVAMLERLRTQMKGSIPKFSARADG
ncbi:MAG: mechanosensitive ion channel [Kofleriaceae bacterium]